MLQSFSLMLAADSVLPSRCLPFDAPLHLQETEAQFAFSSIGKLNETESDMNRRTL